MLCLSVLKYITKMPASSILAQAVEEDLLILFSLKLHVLQNCYFSFSKIRTLGRWLLGSSFTLFLSPTFISFVYIHLGFHMLLSMVFTCSMFFSFLLTRISVPCGQQFLSIIRICPSPPPPSILPLWRSRFIYVC